MKPIPPPRTETELMEHLAAITGKTLADLANAAGVVTPEKLHRTKGWMGQLLEYHLGASAGSLSEPDFQQIGVELKTIPLNAIGAPQESTYVCTAPLLDTTGLSWKKSAVYRKLARVLWVPILADAKLSIAERRILPGFLWSPSDHDEKILRDDWEELTDMISLGQLEAITARHGTYLQIRPKAAHGRSLTFGMDAEGKKILTLPRGFYLRAHFTKKILPDFNKVYLS